MQIKRCVFAVVVSTSLAVSCHQRETLPTTTRAIAVESSALFRDGVTLRVDAIRDSRCPINAECIWAGNAQVTFTASKGPYRTQDTLCLGCGPTGLLIPEKTLVTLGTERYQVTLIDVRPYPNVAAPEVKPQAVFRVERQ